MLLDESFLLLTYHSDFLGEGSCFKKDKRYVFKRTPHIFPSNAVCPPLHGWLFIGGPQAISSQDVLGASPLHLGGPRMAQPSLSPSPGHSRLGDHEPLTSGSLPGRVSCKRGAEAWSQQVLLGAVACLWPTLGWGQHSTAPEGRGPGQPCVGRPCPLLGSRIAFCGEKRPIVCTAQVAAVCSDHLVHLFYFGVNIRNSQTPSYGLDLGFTVSKTWNPLQLCHQPWGVFSLVLVSRPEWRTRGVPQPHLGTWVAWSVAPALACPVFPALESQKIQNWVISLPISEAPGRLGQRLCVEVTSARPLSVPRFRGYDVNPRALPCS